MKQQHIVVLTGAGVSAESGLKTFRDSDGLWNGYDVYEVASPAGWQKNPALVLDFYNARRRDVAAASPNAAHTGLAELEKHFKVTIITQNIDDLHERGGSSRVMHLHGQIFEMRTVADHDSIFEIRGDIVPGDKGPDGTQLRPNIVWFGEEVPMINEAIAVLDDCDFFVVVGTSLQVYPAASLLQYVPRGIKKFIIDRQIPSLPRDPDLVIIEQPATSGVALLKKMLLGI
ncbi:MAG: Sir2 family NAD-dependent protein deacetylase [Ferruginibacter sp.]|nr:Sir2 family NAD-dependent protein deacetylase [Ferruginibacter sp.]